MSESQKIFLLHVQITLKLTFSIFLINLILVSVFIIGNFQLFMDITMNILLKSMGITNTISVVLFLYSFVLLFISALVLGFSGKIKLLFGVGIGLGISIVFAVVSIGFRITIGGVV